MPDRTIPTQPPANAKPQGTESDWKAKVADWAYQLTVLQVVTYVGRATVATDGDGLPTSVTLDADGDPFVTVCNLIGGDITNVIPEIYKDDATLQAFHASQVEKAGQILPNNIRILSDLISKVI